MIFDVELDSTNTLLTLYNIDLMEKLSVVLGVWDILTTTIFYSS